MIELIENWKFLRASGSSVWMESVNNIILKAFHV